MPEVSQKYEELVCVAGITDTGEWRRIYPIPWKLFWQNSEKSFKKKTWIEYELKSDEPSDHRPESRKIKFETVKPGPEASFSEIESLLKERLTTVEDLEKTGTTKQSLGVVLPTIIDFKPMSNAQYEKAFAKKPQKTLDGAPAIRLDIPEYKYQYFFKDDTDGRMHQCLCEDWEVGALYRNCKKMMEEGKYKDETVVHEKVRHKMLNEITRNGPVYFIMGSHFRFNKYMVVGVVYRKKGDYFGIIPGIGSITKEDEFNTRL